REPIRHRERATPRREVSEGRSRPSVVRAPGPTGEAHASCLGIPILLRSLLGPGAQSGLWGQPTAPGKDWPTPRSDARAVPAMVAVGKGGRKLRVNPAG